MVNISQTIFSNAFLNEDIRILIKISLQFVPKGSIDNNSVLVQVMAWRRTGDKPLLETMITKLNDTYMCRLTLMSYGP